MKPFIYLTLFIIFLSLASSCAKNDPKKNELSYILPEGWELINDTRINPQHRKINITTTIGSVVELDLLQGESAGSFTVNEYMKRYMSSALPTDEIQNAAKIDLGTLTRASIEGYLSKVNVGAPFDVNFTLEFFQFDGKHKRLFVVFNTPNEGISQINSSVDKFLGSIQLGN